MNIDQIMTRKTITVGMDDDVRKVKDLFEKHRFHHLLVIEQGRLVGVISDRDLLRNVSPFIGKLSERSQDMSTLNRRVHQIMRRKLVTISSTMKVEEAAQVMLEQRVSCLPVVMADGHVVGVVTWRDLLGGLCGLTRD
ncbi:MAG: CBS domain-containing protein [Candidatus Tectomicrobia bacterium]|uniref:CBS domain-containing protein n=1 Tax=Tectimicrobiota bacterium TaxID=2528274 RepID=A0A933LPJ3_UNCTE|nr:CBS domain-containing protein [Candidatus Tectomicrobia bacterium]